MSIIMHALHAHVFSFGARKFEAFIPSRSESLNCIFSFLLHYTLHITLNLCTTTLNLRLFDLRISLFTFILFHFAAFIFFIPTGIHISISSSRPVFILHFTFYITTSQPYTYTHTYLRNLHTSTSTPALRFPSESAHDAMRLPRTPSRQTTPPPPSSSLFTHAYALVLRPRDPYRTHHSFVVHLIPSHLARYRLLLLLVSPPNSVSPYHHPTNPRITSITTRLQYPVVHCTYLAPRFVSLYISPRFVCVSFVFRFVCPVDSVYIMHF
ncbi:hypothetical protein C8R43DRAFT_1000208 [Mycena crocata]|nr:hypothetical protein C8R43DRAFT_1000208 [Mycena crocata]